MSDAAPSGGASPPGRPVVLAVLDGWGEAAPGPGNAIDRATTPSMDALLEAGADRVSCVVAASGEAVGVPRGVMGNSEVGHLTLGAGRVVEQELLRIGRAVESGEIARRPALSDLFSAVRASGGRLHHLGLCSDGSVHSHLDHLEALVRAAAAAGVDSQRIHAVTDGRDTSPRSGRRHVARVERLCDSVDGARIATVSGRYWAMDRDRRWERTERAWKALVEGKGERAGTALEAVERAYRADIGDEFIAPTVVDPDGRVRDGDAVLFFNFRADRARQLTRAFTEEGFDAFDVRSRPELVGFATMTRYSADFDLPTLFEPQEPAATLGQAFADAGWPQLRLAETEKYAHVTYFFNGGREAAFAGEERALVPSPKVATYDEAPAMAAEELTRRAVAWIREGGARFLLVNYANADMVGHTGDIDATVKACEAVDRGVGVIVATVLEAGALLVVTADHGNAEIMLDESGAPVTAHTTSPVPVAILDARPSAGPLPALRAHAGLADVAPTLLRLCGLPLPEGMSRDGLEAR